MAPADTGVSPRDAGEESVLGPWQGNYRYRREVKLTNPTMDTAPGGLTIRVTIPHGNHIQSGQAQLPAENEPVSDWHSTGTAKKFLSVGRPKYCVRERHSGAEYLDDDRKAP